MRMSTAFNKILLPRDLLLAIIWFLIIGITACGGGAPDTNNNDDDNQQPSAWERIPIAQVEESGTTIAYVRARHGNDQNIHIAYYAAAYQDDQTYQQIHYLLWNPGTRSLNQNIVENQPSLSLVDGFDRCIQFDFALDAGSIPVFIYPVWEAHIELAQVEADIMANYYENGIWSEYTAAIGYVARNPVYTDGHVSSNMSAAVDSTGNLHICYQFYTEGMDSANFRYPDLYYTQRSRDDLGQILSDAQYGALEELVDGNAFSTYGDHNSVGYFCKLLLDEQEQPTIFYAEHSEQFSGTFALKRAYKNEAGQWRRETIEELPNEWRIGAISAAFFPDGSLGVAYALRAPSPEPDDAHRVKFASNQSGEWVADIVDEATWCGSYCSLAIDSTGIAAIAYHDEQSHSGRPHQFLKFAQFDGTRWHKETIDELGSVGLFNSLWFNNEDRPFICSYNDTDNEILVFRRIDN